MKPEASKLRAILGRQGRVQVFWLTDRGELWVSEVSQGENEPRQLDSNVSEFSIDYGCYDICHGVSVKSGCLWYWRLRGEHLLRTRLPVGRASNPIIRCVRGQITIVAERSEPGGSKSLIALCLANGKWVGPFHLMTADGLSFGPIAADLDARGRLCLVMNKGTETRTNVVYLGPLLVSATHGRFPGPRTISSSSNIKRRPSLLVSPSGTAHCAWFEEASSRNFASYCSVGAEGISKPVEIEIGYRPDDDGPVLAVDQTGAHLLWRAGGQLFWWGVSLWGWCGKLTPLSSALNLELVKFAGRRREYCYAFIDKESCHLVFPFSETGEVSQELSVSLISAGLAQLYRRLGANVLTEGEGR